MRTGLAWNGLGRLGEWLQASVNSLIGILTILFGFLIATPAFAQSVISPSVLVDGQYGGQYSQQMSVVGLNPPLQWSIAGQPNGLVIDASTGVISGRPQRCGTNLSFFVNVAEVANLAGGSKRELRMDIECAFNVTPASFADGFVGKSYSQTIGSDYGFAPYFLSISFGSLPPGLSLVGDKITGTPTTVGTYTFTVGLVDSNIFSTQRSYTMDIRPASTVTIAPSSLPGGEVDAAYSATVTASGGTSPYTYALTGTLPDGITFKNGAFSGKPTEDGDFDVTVTATDANGFVGTRDYTIAIDEAPVVPGEISIAPSSIPGGKVGKAYRVRFTADGGTAPYTFAEADTRAAGLPDGLSLSASGVISGKPTEPGTYAFTIRVADSAGTAARKRYSLKIAAEPTVSIKLTPATLEDGDVGTAYRAKLSAKGGTAPYRFEVTDGELPAGLKLSAKGVISGKPTAAGSSAFTVTATDANGDSGERAYDVSISEAPVVSSAEIAGVTAAQFAAASRFASNQMANINGRLRTLRQDPCTGSSFGIIIAPTETGSQESSLAASDTATATGAGTEPGAGAANNPAARAGRCGETSRFDEAFSIWTGGNIEIGDRDGTANRAAIDFTSSGLTLGADYILSPGTVIGLAAGLGRDKAEVGTEGSEVESTSYALAIYGGIRPTEKTFINAVGGFGWLDSTTSRYVTALDGFASSEREGTQLFGSVTAGYEFAASGFTGEVYTRLDAVSTRLDGTTENGAGRFNATFEDATNALINGSIGAAFRYPIALERGVLTPRVMLEYRHSFDNGIDQEVTFAGLGGQRLSISTDALADDAILFGVGADYALGDFMLGLDYEGAADFEGDYAHTIRARAGVRF